jgi:hypothetical protein
LGIAIIYKSLAFFPKISREYNWTFNGITIESKNLKSAQAAIYRRMKDIGAVNKTRTEMRNRNIVKTSYTFCGNYDIGERLSTAKKHTNDSGKILKLRARNGQKASRVPRVKPE